MARALTEKYHATGLIGERVTWMWLVLSDGCDQLEAEIFNWYAVAHATRELQLLNVYLNAGNCVYRERPLQGAPIQEEYMFPSRSTHDDVICDHCIDF